MNDKITMKKTCDRCRALSKNLRNPTCGLDYPIDLNKTVSTIHNGFSYYDPKPLEPCPKPLTYSKYHNTACKPA